MTSKQLEQFRNARSIVMEAVQLLRVADSLLHKISPDERTERMNTAINVSGEANAYASSTVLRISLAIDEHNLKRSQSNKP